MVMEEHLKMGSLINTDEVFKTQFNCFFNSYEFYGSNLLDMKKANNFANKMYDNYANIYFELNKDLSFCREMITGLKFTKVNSNERLFRYFNEETGLYILYIPQIKEKIDLRKMVNLLFNSDYIKDIEDFFDNYKLVNEKDKELVNKSHQLMLTKGKMFTE